MKRISKRMILLAATFIGAVACMIDSPESPGKKVNFTFEVEENVIVTKSILPETVEFENTINDVTLMAFDSSSGEHEVSIYSSNGDYSMTLLGNDNYTIYAFVNMGDLRSQSPDNLSGIAEVKYTIPSFTGLAAKGLPMAGKTTIEAQSSAKINVRRLVAKLVISIDHSEMDLGGDNNAFANGTIRIHNSAKVLRPFAKGGSVAQNPSELFEEVTDCQSVSEQYSPVTKQLIFYTPENMQGNLLSGNADPWNKSESNINLDSSCCTYISFDGTKDGGTDGVSGDMIYRFYPGYDDVKNFDLEGGKQYTILLKLSWNGMFTEGNWKVDKSSWNDAREILLSSSSGGPFTNSETLTLPIGTKDYPYYVFYTVDDGVSGQHKNYGWKFSNGSNSAVCTGSLTLSNGIEFNYENHNAYRAKHSVSIPDDQSLAGKTISVKYHTNDNRCYSYLNVNIIDKETDEGDGGDNGGNTETSYIEIDKEEVTHEYNFCGSSNTFEVRVTGGNVPLSSIYVTSSNSNLHTEYDSSTGVATCYWLSDNTSTYARSANITFFGTGATAKCTATQKGIVYTFDIDPKSISKGWNETGSENAFQIKVVNSTVPLSNIGIKCSSTLYLYNSYDETTGIATCYLNQLNSGYSDRTITLTFTGSGITRTCNIVQRYNDSYISLDPETDIRAWNESGASNPVNIRVATNMDYSDISVTTYSSYITIDYDPDTGTATYFWNSDNTGSSNKTAKIYFNGGRTSATFEAIQAYDDTDYYINLSPSTITKKWNESGENNAFTISVDTNIPLSELSMSEYSTYLESSFDNATGTATCYWSSDNSSLTESRTATLTFSGNGIKATATIIQEQDDTQYYIIASPTKISMAYNEYGIVNMFYYYVTDTNMALGDISASDDSDDLWTYYDSSTGKVSCYWYNENTGPTEKTANVTLSGKGVTTILKATQKVKSEVDNNLGIDDNVGNEGGGNIEY